MAASVGPRRVGSSAQRGPPSSSLLTTDGGRVWQVQAVLAALGAPPSLGCVDLTPDGTGRWPVITTGVDPASELVVVRGDGGWDQTGSVPLRPEAGGVTFDATAVRTAPWTDGENRHRTQTAGAASTTDGGRTWTRLPARIANRPRVN